MPVQDSLVLLTLTQTEPSLETCSRPTGRYRDSVAVAFHTRDLPSIQSFWCMLFTKPLQPQLLQ